VVRPPYRPRGVPTLQAQRTSIGACSGNVAAVASAPRDRPWLSYPPDTAQRIADTLGVLLPTDRITDLAHAQADVRLTPHPQAPVTATTEAMLQHHAAIEAERGGREGLLSTIGKDWILGSELFPAASPRRTPLWVKILDTSK
jgi:hypothetical protein